VNATVERNRGSQVMELSVTETAGIPGATLQKLQDGTFLVTSDAEFPPNPEELHALLLEFMPADWELLDSGATEAHDLAYYGPPAQESTHEPAVPEPRRAA
jgi:hypothetical protein